MALLQHQAGERERIGEDLSERFDSLDLDSEFLLFIPGILVSAACLFSFCVMLWTQTWANDALGMVLFLTGLSIHLYYFIMTSIITDSVQPKTNKEGN